MQKTPSKLDLTGTGYCAAFTFRRTARAVTRLFDTALQKSGMRSTQLSILVAIAKNQPVSMGAVADILVIDRTTLTRSLRPLQKDGLLSVTDRGAMRQRFLALTPAGERALARSVRAWRRAQERFVSSIGPRYWTGLRNELERLAHIAMELESPQKECSTRAIPGSPRAERSKLSTMVN